MTGGVTISSDGATVTVRVPMVLRRRGGRKVVVAPEGSDWAPPRPRIDNTLVKALARAFRWRRMLESSGRLTVRDIADAEQINSSYVSRVLRLTLLSPEIVDSILNGRAAEILTLARLMEPFPDIWMRQKETLY
ncbi:MAG: hypothetical protein AB7N54_19620 [Alphaproteobacteria bacterium]